MKTRLLSILVLAVLVSCFYPQVVSADNLTAQVRTNTPKPTVSNPKTPTGFYWPTGTENWGKYAGWMAEGCADGKTNTYFSGMYHVGADIKATAKDSVYAIADGEVVFISQNGWGDGNVGVLIKHYLANGNPFIALYGHVRNNVKIGTGVKAGEKIAEIGIFYESPTKRADHLHFGIIPGDKYPTKGFGKMDCPFTDTNGFANPREWITTKYPKQPVYKRTTTPIARIVPTTTRASVTRAAPIKTGTPPVLNQRDYESVIRYVMRLLGDKQPQLIEKLVGKDGTAFAAYAMGYMPPGRNNAREVIAELTKAVKNASPTCLGYDAVEGPSGINKVTFYIKGLNCDTSGFCKEAQGSKNKFGWILNREQYGNWYLVAVGPVQPPFDSDLKPQKPCPE